MLVPDGNQPGLWVNKAWRAGTPGTFAFVVGISDYTKLDGSIKSLTLGKLPVGALSAFRFFEWLEKDYFITGCPLAMCWLLLAPSKAELELAPRMSEASLLPDFAACDTAIHAWVDEMDRLPAVAAAESRSIFFFMGHGLEEIEDRQFLLPRDYEPARNVERAMTTDNLASGLKRLKVPLHFMFLDACRSDYDKRSEYAPLKGTAVLNAATPKTINKASRVSTFYASAAGSTSWSPDLKVGSLSVYSQALIEGLRARGLKPECDPDKCYVYLRLLEPFMATRMPEILRVQYRSSEWQEPRARGDQVLKQITELISPQPYHRLPPSAPEPTLDLGGPSLPISGDAIGISVQGATPGKITDDEMRAYLDGARLYSFSTKEWLLDGNIEIANLRREQGTDVYQFDLRFPRVPKGQLYWLKLSNGVQTVGCALPVDVVEQTVFRVTVTAVSQPIGPAQVPVALVNFKVTLSENTSGLLREAMQLWWRAEKGILTLGDLQTSFLQTPFSERHSSIENSKISFLGAMITASTLSRTAEWNLLGDWARALTSANSSTTDGAVLWTERSLRREKGSAVEALKYFMLLDTAPLPILSHTISLALRHAEYFGSADSLPDVFKPAIARIHRRLVGAVGTFRPGGLFGCFMGRVGQFGPETIAAPTVHDEFRLRLSRAVLETPARAKKTPALRFDRAGEIEEATVSDAEETLRALERALRDAEAAEAGPAKATAES